MSDTLQSDHILAIIPARGGSKSIPRKNLVPLGGKPLLAWPIELALSIKRIGRVIISTDDAEIAQVAKRYGAEVPFKRPASLASDETSTLPVLQHCLRFLLKNEGYRPQIVLLLYATTPFMSKVRIEEALDRFEETGCNSVVGVVKDWGRFWKSSHGQYVPFYPTRRLNRQFYQPLYREAGNIYFSRYEVIMELKKIVDERIVQFLFIDSEEEMIDIDTQDDLRRAQEIAARLHR